MIKEREEIMTAFVKEKFSWDGMYLMYTGEFEGSRTMEQVRPECHVSWHGMPERTFVARFKYGSKPYKSWVNYLVKNVSIEEYIAVSAETSPIEAMEHFGFKARKKRHFPQAEGNYGLRNGFGIERMA